MNRHYGNSERGVAVHNRNDPWEELKWDAEEFIDYAVYDPEGRSCLPIQVALDVDVGADSSYSSLLSVWVTLTLSTGGQKKA